MTASEAPELTAEECEVVQLMAAGLTDERIAKELGVGTATVQRRLRAAAKALGAQSRVELAVKALAKGLVSAPDEDAETESGAGGEAN